MLVGYDWSACLPRTGRTASQARWPSTQGFGKQFGTLIEYCNWLIRLTRRGGRAVDCTGLENRRPLTGFVSSNLTLSATAKKKRIGALSTSLKQRGESPSKRGLAKRLAKDPKRARTVHADLTWRNATLHCLGMLMQRPNVSRY